MKISREKIEAYNKLVEKINNYDEMKLKEIQLVPCKESNEVNFWAYWQGGRDHLDADILLVGQDWGTIDYKAEPIADAVVNNPDAVVDFCYMKDNKNITNRNICDLLEAMYPSVDFRSDCNTQKQLFFTNFVPWYRVPGAKISGGYNKHWYEPSAEVFLDLVSIIEPKIIMCLGEKTYKNVCTALEIEDAKRGKNFTAIIENGCHQTVINGNEIMIFPLMHPGYWGTRARLIEKQKGDWVQVRKQLDKMHGEMKNYE